MAREDFPDEDARGAHFDTRLARLERSLSELSARLRVLEQRLDLASPAPVAARTEKQTVADASIDAARADQTASAGAAVEDYPFNVPPRGADESSEDYLAAQVSREAGAASAVAGARRDFESLVGGSWFNWLGIIAVTLGVAFFLKYAFENEWVGPTGRVLLGGAAGACILTLAERLRLRGYRSYAYVLSGGSILILYLSVYAARGFYELIGVATAFLLMSVVTATAVALSVRYDARPIAALGLLGGFATPVLLSTGVDRQLALFGYVALLDAGVLAVAYFKRWRFLNHFAFVATALTFAGWWLAYYEEWKLWRTLFFLTLFFVTFAALAVVHNALPRRPARWTDISLLVANATLYFAAGYGLIAPRHHAFAGTFALFVSLFFAALFHLARARNRGDELLAFAYAAACVTFLTVAVAIQLDQQWVTIGWATEGLLLAWLGLRTDTRAARYAALPVLAFAMLHWFTVDAPEVALRADASFIPLLNKRAISAATLVAALGGAAWLHRRAEDSEEAERALLAGGLIMAANLLALALLTLDVNDYFSRRIGIVPAAVADDLPLDNTRHLALTLLWTLYAVALFWVGLRRRLKFLRLAGLALLAVAGLKVLAADALFYDAEWHAPLFNQTFTAFAALALAAGYIAHSYARALDVDRAERRNAVALLTVFGNLFVVVALSLEASGYFRKQLAERVRGGAPVRDLRLAQQLSLSLVWATYGGAMLLFGHLRQNRLLRLMALALLTATTVKVFFFDLAALERFYRIISFIALGLILLSVSFLYQQRQRRTAKAEGA